jgi:hypothetical protein
MFFYASLPVDKHSARFETEDSFLPARMRSCQYGQVENLSQSVSLVHAADCRRKPFFVTISG